MTIGNIYYTEEKIMGCRNSRSNKVNRRLRELHCLVRDFLENNEDVSDSLDENLEELIEVFCNLKCTVKEQQSTLESYVEIKEWIDKNANCYAPNAENCECERLNRNVEKILKEITRELLESLNDLNRAIKSLENAQCLQNKLDKAFQKYVECVHEEDSSCEC